MIERLFDLFNDSTRLMVLTGAGCSAASGIPTYRDHDGVWQRSTPIQHQDFIARPASRRRYWARSFLGWPPVAAARPGPAHRALASLEASGLIDSLVTQNVDGLHQKAGHHQVVDLHGRLDQVLCLDCASISSRAEIQHRLAALNPHLGTVSQRWTLAPDGDADVDALLQQQMRIPECPHCGGVLKPHVVFFGDSVPRDKVDAVFAMLDECDALLVVGSSLMVYSGYRFCRHAAQTGKALACINAGRTRADELFDFKLQSDCGVVLEQVCARLDVLPGVPVRHPG